MLKSYQEINAETIDRWIEEGWEWGQPISHETYLNAKNGNWDVLLTPVNPVPHEWFGNLKDKKNIGTGFWWWTANAYICCFGCKLHYFGLFR